MTLDKKNIKVSVPKLATSESSITVPKGGAKSVKFSYSNCPEKVKARWQTTNKKLFSGSWGKWSNKSISLSLKGKTVGSGHLKILLVGSKTGDIYGSKTIPVIVSSQPSVKFSAAKYNINTGNSATAKVSYSNLTEKSKLTVSSTNSNAFSVAWGSASGQTRTLNIAGKKKGTGTVTVYLKSVKTGKVLAKTSATVNVSQSPKVTVASSNVSVKTGETVKVKCTASGVSGKYSFACSPGKTSKYTASWGKRSNNSNTLSLKGVNAGSDKVTVYIKNSSGKKISTATINITVNSAAKPAVTLSKSSLRINKGRSDLIKTTLTNMPVGATRVHVSWDSSVCDCLPEWTGRYPTVSVKGIGTGSCKVTISIIQKNTNKTVASATASVNVTITDKINVISYSKNYTNRAISIALGCPSKKICRYMYAGRDADTVYNHYQYIYSDKRIHGNCYGISTTAGLLYSPNNIYPSNFNPSASVTQKLALTYKNSSWGISVGEWIQAMQISQVARTCKKYPADLNQIVDVVKSDINNNRATTLSLRWDGKGHAVLAYAFEKVSNNQDRIYIYDSNSPLTTQYIYLTKNNKKYTDWTYSLPYDKKTLRKSNTVLKYNTYSNYSDLWKMHGSNKTNGKLNSDLYDYNLASINSDNFIIEDVEDNVIATVTNGELNTTDERISIADVDDYFEGEEESAGTFMYLPIDVYAFVNKETEAGSEPFMVQISNLDLSTQVETTGDEITLCADDSSDFASAVLDTEVGDDYQITLGSAREGEPEEMQWEGVGAGDTVSIMLSDGNLETCNLESAQLTIGDDNDGVQKEKVYIVNATAEEGGTINPGGDDPVWQGEDQQYLISPNAGYVIKDVFVDEHSVGPVDKYTFNNVHENHTINAIFEKDTNPTDIKNAEIVGVVSKVYSGKPLRQAPVVTVDGKVLSEYTDYEISYKNNINVGTATITISGVGNYTGTISKNFQIKPTGTKFAKCSGGAKKVILTWKKQSKQTTGYQIRYSAKKNFKSGVKTVVVKKTKMTKKVIKKLKKGKKYYFQIRTYKRVGNNNIYSGWSKVKAVKAK